MTWASMNLEEVYTPLSRHLGDGYNTERFWAKYILLILTYVFDEGPSDGFSYHFGHSIVPLRV